MPCGDRPASRQRGFSYLALLFAVAVMGLLLAAASELWHTTAQRERERELLFIGKQYREAIGRYYLRSPGARQYPQSLDDLIDDRRFPQTVRHLRKRYRDPISGKDEWGLVVEQGRIIGIHSQSTQTPLKRANFAKADAEFADRASYAEWQFIYRPADQTAGVIPGAPQTSGAAVPGPNPAAAGRPTGEEQRQAAQLQPNPQLATCTAEHIASLRRCAALAFDDAQSCFKDAAERRNTCLAGVLDNHD